MKVKILILSIISILITSCAVLQKSDIELKYRATADYLNMEKKLLRVESVIRRNCNNKVINESDCKRAKRYYEVAKHTYIISGYYFKALYKPENSVMYFNQAIKDSEFIRDKFSKYPDMAYIIASILDVMTPRDNERVEEKVTRLIKLIDDQIIDNAINQIIIKSMEE